MLNPFLLFACKNEQQTGSNYYSPGFDISPNTFNCMSGKRLHIDACRFNINFSIAVSQWQYVTIYSYFIIIITKKKKKKIQLYFSTFRLVAYI